MVSDNVNFIIERGSKFDELALMIFSIATKCHIDVIHSDNSMLTTNESGDMEECDVLFLNRGKLMFEAIESIQVEHEDKEAKTVAEKEDPTYYPEEEEEDYEGGGDGGEGEGEEEEEPEEGEEEVGGEKVSLAVAVVPPVQRQTPKKESIAVQFNTLMRSARKRQQEEMMRDVESEMDLNQKKEEERKTQGALVRGKPIMKPVESVPLTMETQSAPVKPQGDEQSGVPVKPKGDEQSGAPVKPKGGEQSGAPVKPKGDEQSGAPVKPKGDKQCGAPVKPKGDEQSGGPVKPKGDEQSGAPVKPKGDKQSGAPVKCNGDEQSGAPVKPGDKEQPGVPVKPTSGEMSGAPEDAPTKRVKCARRSEPKGAPENVGK